MDDERNGQLLNEWNSLAENEALFPLHHYFFGVLGTNGFPPRHTNSLRVGGVHLLRLLHRGSTFVANCQNTDIATLLLLNALPIPVVISVNSERVCFTLLAVELNGGVGPDRSTLAGLLT